MKPQRVTFGRMYPNAGYTARYRREIKKLIRAMNQETRSEILLLYSDKANDGMLRDLQSVMKKLREKWKREFERRAKQMAEWLADKTQKRTRKDVQKQLKNMGFALTPNYTDAQKAEIAKFVEESVNLIKTIPMNYLNDVQDIVRDAVERGGDRATIHEAIKDKFDHPLVNKRAGESDEDALKRAERRADLIAKDQVQKVTQQMAMSNAKAYGATKGEWIHIPGEKTSRITHIHFDGQTFDLDKGLYDEDVGEYVLPGQLIYCMCSFSALWPGTE